MSCFYFDVDSAKLHSQAQMPKLGSAADTGFADANY
jgi:hypothetical protein